MKNTAPPLHVYRLGKSLPINTTPQGVARFLAISFDDVLHSHRDGCLLGAILMMHVFNSGGRSRRFRPGSSTWEQETAEMTFLRRAFS